MKLKVNEQRLINKAEAVVVPGWSKYDLWVLREVLPKRVQVLDDNPQELWIPINTLRASLRHQVRVIVNRYVRKDVYLRHPEYGRVRIEGVNIDRVTSEEVFTHIGPGAVCVFLDENVSNKWVRGVEGLTLIGRLTKDLILQWDEHDESIAPVLKADPSPSTMVMKKKRGRAHVQASQTAKAGKKVRIGYTVPEEYGGRSYEVKPWLQPGESPVSGTLLIEGVGEVKVTPPAKGRESETLGVDRRSFKETHDRFLVALGAGWPTCPVWFSTINEALFDRGVKTTIHCTLDASDSMMSALKRAYGSGSSRPERDGIARYAVVVDVPEARTDPQKGELFLREGISKVLDGSVDRLVVVRADAEGGG